MNKKSMLKMLVAFVALLSLSNCVSMNDMMKGNCADSGLCIYYYRIYEVENKYDNTLELVMQGNVLAYVEEDYTRIELNPRLVIDENGNLEAYHLVLIRTNIDGQQKKHLIDPGESLVVLADEERIALSTKGTELVQNTGSSTVSGYVSRIAFSQTMTKATDTAKFQTTLTNLFQVLNAKDVRLRLKGINGLMERYFSNDNIVNHKEFRQKAMAFMQKHRSKFDKATQVIVDQILEDAKHYDMPDSQKPENSSKSSKDNWSRFDDDF